MTSQDQTPPPTPEEIAQTIQEEAEILNQLDEQNRIACSPEIKGLLYPENKVDRAGKVIVTAIELDGLVERVPLHNLFEPGRAITLEFVTYSGILYRKGSRFMLISNYYGYCVYFKVLDIVPMKPDERGRARHSIESIRYLEGVD